jgi:hypothetical protein
MPTVHNKYHKTAAADAVYIGRPSKWGNPFTHKDGTIAQYKVSSREEAVLKYEEWLMAQPELVESARKELAGKDLVCWCKPAATIFERRCVRLARWQVGWSN